MAQSRKQKVMGQVQRQRRQRTIISFVIVIALIAIIVGVVVFYPRTPPDPVQLVPYLDHCVPGNATLVYHSHPDLVIVISGSSQPLPNTFESGYDVGCSRVMHTHDSTGVIHVETDQDVTYTLGDWFLVWGHWAGSTTTATFNSTYVLGNKAGPGTGHSLSMTINGSPDNNPADFKDGNPANFQSLLLPRNAETGTDSCQLGGSITSCVPFTIQLTYT